MEITSEGWVVLKVTDTDDTIWYKIFSSWRSGDSWRLSSGATDKSQLVDNGDHFVWPQQSGTVYLLPKDFEGGMSIYTASVLDDLSSAAQASGALVERITLNDAEIEKAH